ncbi:hypothetical protein GQ457_01G019080 [Hibiscus cannabinus]
MLAIQYLPSLRPRLTYCGHCQSVAHRFILVKREEYVIIEYVPNEPGTNSLRASQDKFEKHMDDMLDVGCLVLATIALELQKRHEYVVSYEMIQNLYFNAKCIGH